jgi:Tol biopolymer transport system component
LFRIAFRRDNVLKVSLVTGAAMLAICLLALAETTNTAEAEDSLPEYGKIAFSIIQGQSHNIYTVDPDGSSLSRLTNIANSTYYPQPAWSPDGTKLAFENEESIWVINADGSNLRVLTLNTSDLSDSSVPAWSPDGKKLAFTGFSEPNSLGTADIYTMDVDGSNITNVTKSPGVYEGGIEFSPDGSQMCLTRSIQEIDDSLRELRKNGIYVMNADASNPTQVTNGQAGGCAWSPDGKKIAYTYEQPKQRGATIQDIEVYVMNADGSEKTNLTSNRNWDAKPNREAEGGPEWSPDGRRIAFTSNRDGDLDGSYTSDIYTMDADGSDVVQVTKTPSIDESAPDWQPLTPKSRSMTVHQPDTGGLSLLLVASALLFSGAVIFYAGLKRRM